MLWHNCVYCARDIYRLIDRLESLALMPRPQSAIDDLQDRYDALCQLRLLLEGIDFANLEDLH